MLKFHSCSVCFFVNIIKYAISGNYIPDKLRFESTASLPLVNNKCRFASYQNFNVQIVFQKKDTGSLQQRQWKKSVSQTSVGKYQAAEIGLYIFIFRLETIFISLCLGVDWVDWVWVNIIFHN